MVRQFFSRGTGVTITGFALIAVTYGLIRFSYGQFMPSIREDLGLSESMSGVISSALFAGNCFALLFAALATERFGGRAVATFAATLATTGLLGMAFSPNPITFSACLLIAGSSAGLSMPPLVAAIVENVRMERQALATTIVNAGTSIGILISGPIALYFSGLWRFSFVGFAVLALFTTLSTLCLIPKGKPPLLSRETKVRVWHVPAAGPLLASAFLFGVVCASFWTFGGEVLKALGNWTVTDLSWYWVLIGVAGLIGAPAGMIVKSIGIRSIHSFSYLTLATSIILLGLAEENAIFPVIAGIMFGVIYILQTGVYLVWGLRILPERPATIVAATFFMLPLGQVLGSICFGLAMELLGIRETLFGFVLLCLLGALYMPVRQRTAIKDLRQTA